MRGRALTLAAALAAVAASCALGDDDVPWTTARRGELVVGVDVTGQLASTESHPLGPPPLPNVWNFKIAFLAGEGDQVEAGAPVLGLDPSDLTRRLEEYRNEADSAAKQLEAHRAAARMALAEGELAVEQARAAERKAALKAEGGAGILASNEIERTRLDHEFAVHALEIARRKVKARTRQDGAETERLVRVVRRAEQRVDELQQGIAQMRVAAPIAGTVLHVTDWQGNKKKVGDNAWRAERIVEVVSLEHMKADGEVDEMDASRVAVGQTVRLRLDANADLELHGEVVKIEDAVQRRAPEDPLKVVKLEIALASTAEVELRPGMRFRGLVETERIDDVLVVPLAAVFAGADGAFVYKRDGRGATATPVTLGRRDARMVEVLTGLAEGDRVALPEAAAGSPEGAR
jgi:HlyD family secretion protein